MSSRRSEGPPGEQRARCPHFPACVGCPCVGTPYGRQLAAKQEILRCALDAHPELRRLRLEPPCGSPRAFGYRNQAKLVFRRRRAPGGASEVVLGVYRPGTHSVLPAERCIVHHRRLQPVLRRLRALVEALAIPVFDERTRDGSLRYALARASEATGDVHLTLVSAVADPPRLRELLRRLRVHEPAVRAAYLCVNPTPGNALLGPDIRRLFGPPALVDRFGELELASVPDAFLQVNRAVAERIYDTAAAWLRPAPEETALDLYSGVGAMALWLAPALRRVVGVEASASAVSCARANAAANGIRNADFLVGDAAEAARLASERGLGRPSIVAVNPPRKGLGSAVVGTIAELAPSRVLYVSCDPRTLARDLAALGGRGFAVRRVRAFDMMPQTPHVEAVALLERR